MLTSDRQQANQRTALENLRAVLVPAAIVTILLVVAVLLFWQLRPSGAPAAQKTDLPAAGSPIVGSGDGVLGKDWLKRAGDALSERRLLAPAGDNAIEYYLRAAAEPTTSVAARQALLELLSPAVAEVRATIAAGDWAEAEREIQLLQRMDVSELRLTDMRRSLAEARASASAPTAIEEQPQAPLVANEAPAATTIDASQRAQPAATASVEAPAVVEPVAPTSRTTRSVAAQPDPPAATTRADSDAAAQQPMTSPAPRPSSSVVVEPVQIADARPTYPPAATRRRIEGLVDLEFTIGTDGSLSDIVVVRSEPPGVFDREAMRAAMRWRFKPKTINGAPTAARGRKTLTFRLGQG